MAVAKLDLPDRRSDKYGSSVTLDYQYDYDQNGNLLALSDALGIDTRDMTYDELDRLETVDGPVSSPTYEGQSDYAYDAQDNIFRWTIRPVFGGEPVQIDFNYSFNGNRLDSFSGGSFGYNGRGQLTSRTVNGRTNTLVFDQADRLTQVYGTDPGDAYFSESYAYDAQGHRTVSTNLSGQKRYDVWTRDGQRLYSEDQWDGKKHRFIYLGGRLVAEVKTAISNGATETLYHHTDHLGSATSITRTNGSKVNQGNANIDTIRSAYGRIVLGAEPNGPGYAGHIGDRDSDLTYMKARYYDSMAMRFISPDPVDVNPGNGGNFNRYWYANNNPYKFVDPDGRLGLIGAGIGAIVGGIVNGGIEGVRQYRAGEFKPWELGVETLEGVAVGAAVGSTGGIGSGILVGGAAGAAGHAGSEYVKGNEITVGGTVEAGVVTAAGGGLGNGLGNLLKPGLTSATVTTQAVKETFVTRSGRVAVVVSQPSVTFSRNSARDVEILVETAQSTIGAGPSIAEQMYWAAQELDR